AALSKVVAAAYLDAVASLSASQHPNTGTPVTGSGNVASTVTGLSGLSGLSEQQLEAVAALASLYQSSHSGSFGFANITSSGSGNGSGIMPVYSVAQPSTSLHTGHNVTGLSTCPHTDNTGLPTITTATNANVNLSAQQQQHIAILSKYFNLTSQSLVSAANNSVQPIPTSSGLIRLPAPGSAVASAIHGTSTTLPSSVYGLPAAALSSASPTQLLRLGSQASNTASVSIISSVPFTSIPTSHLCSNSGNLSGALVSSPSVTCLVPISQNPASLVNSLSAAAAIPASVVPSTTISCSNVTFSFPASLSTVTYPSGLASIAGTSSLASGGTTSTTAMTTHPITVLPSPTASSLLPPAPTSYRGSITTGQSAQQIQLQAAQQAQQQQISRY
ncbi:unnamed protein product, partial [Protopolystoma xenopodis]